MDGEADHIEALKSEEQERNCLSSESESRRMARRRRRSISRSRTRSRSRRSRSRLGRRQGRKRVPKMKSAVLAAVLSLKSKRGVTSVTVARRIKSKYGTGNLPKNFRGAIGRTLRGLARAGKLERVRGRFRIKRTGGRHGRSRSRVRRPRRRGLRRRSRRSRRRRSRGGRRRRRRSRSRGGRRTRRRRRRTKR